MKSPVCIITLFLGCLALFTACNKQVPAVFKSQQDLRYSHSWEKLENYPVRSGRSDDLYFFTPQKGFVINSLGYLFQTNDGGQSWETKFRKERTFFRCLTFKNEEKGWLGTLGTGDVALRSTDTISLYETRDSGNTWTPTEFMGPYPKGLCGLQTVSNNMIVGCGRVRGPSYFIKTKDGGDTWYSYDYNHLAGSLIAPYFYDEQHGILIGGTTTEKINCRSLILETFDGGTTWDTLYISKQRGEYCWKVSFPSEQKGFISIQRNVDDGYFYVLETNDGGQSWKENIYIDEPDYVQGIGFINESVGWMGGSTKWTMETRDGGESWQRMADVGRGFNKFQFFGDSLAYGVGFGVFKMNDLQPLPNGFVTTHFPDGTIKSTLQYEKGSQQGNAIFYHPNSQIKNKGKLRENLRHGKWHFYNNKGDKVKTIKYRNGVAKIPQEVVKKYVGKYQINDRDYRTISYTDGQLYSKHSRSKTNHKIYPVSDTEFLLDVDKNWSIDFVSNTKGEVEYHLMKTNSQEVKARKVVVR